MADSVAVPPPPGTTAVSVPPTAAAPEANSYAALRNAARAKADAAAKQVAQKGRDLDQQIGEPSRAYAREVAQDAGQAAEETADALQESKPALQGVAKSARDRAEVLRAKGTAVAESNVAALRATAAQAEADAVEMAARAERHASQVATAAVDVARQQFEARWQAVQEQERQLAMEAAKLEKYERQLLALTKNDEPNFPRKCCCIDPIVYHNILAEVPSERQSFVRTAYSNYYFTIVLLIYNFAIALTMMFVDDDPTKAAATVDLAPHMGVAVLILFGIILAFVLWYWPTYKACATGSAGQHIMSRIGIIVAFLFNLVMTLGPIGFGGCGLLYGMYIKKVKGDNAFYPPLINALLWGLQGLYYLFMLWRMWCVYGKEDRATLARAQTEMAVGGVFR